jgi:IS30 family transposase
VDEYSTDEILRMADKMNARPRKSLGYYRPDELFDAFLDKMYSTDIVA